MLADLSTEFSALVASPLMAALAQWSATEELLPASCAKLYAILQIVQKLPAESVAPSLTTALLKLPKLIVASLSATMSTEGTNVSHTLLASTLRVLAKVLPSSSKDLVAVVREVVHTLFANVPSTTAAATATTPKSAKKAKAAAVTATEPLALEPFDGSHLFQASSLEALLSILEQDTFAASSILSGEERIQLVQASIYSLQAALSSHQRRLRLASVQLERWLVKGLGISTLDTMLELAVSVDDNGDADLGNYRNKLLHIGQFHERVGSFFASTGSKSNDAIPNVVSLFSPLPSLFLLGVLKTPFSHVWSLAIELLSKEANARPAVFWSLVVPQLQSLQAKYEQQLVGSAEEQAFQKLEHLVESAREQLLPLSEADKAAAAAERSERETSTTKNWKRSIAVKWMFSYQNIKKFYHSTKQRTRAWTTLTSLCKNVSRWSPDLLWPSICSSPKQSSTMSRRIATTRVKCTRVCGTHSARISCRRLRSVFPASLFLSCSISPPRNSPVQFYFIFFPSPKILNRHVFI